MIDELDLTFDGPDGAWLRAQLEPIVGAPVAPALDAIRRRAATAPAPPDAMAPRRRSRRRLALVAAALLVAAAVVVARQHGGPPKERKIVTTVPEPTGWFVPQGLPAGWTLTDARASTTGPSCARRGYGWSDGAATTTVGLSFDACGEVPTAEALAGSDAAAVPPGAGPGVEEVELGAGVTGVALRIGDDLVSRSPSPFEPVQRMVAWSTAEGVWTLRTIGLDEAPFLAAARVAAPDPDAADEGMRGALGLDARLVDRWSSPAGEQGVEVELSLTSPDGHPIGAISHPPGQGLHPAGDSILASEELPGQPLAVWRLDGPPGAARFGGSWPGADVTVYRWGGDASAWIDDDQLRAFVASLRPATASEWWAFLDTATGTVTPELRRATTLAGLASGEPIATTTTGPGG